ncbi:MAG: lysozyme inhibitor LprI family protein [Phormidesmis sp. CAN_BIN44]|nr:lysozyme inhibitor LprI family protein [Phormidesmis sp. CAN_BIN44]
MNQVYQQVRAKYRGTKQETLLSDAEEAWLKFRDARS